MSGKKQGHGNNHKPAKNSPAEQRPKQQQNSKSPKGQATATQKPGSAKLWIAGVATIAAVIVIVVLMSGGSGGGSGKGASNAPADEAKYIGRLLPAGYAEPKPLKRAIYTSTIKQTDVTATDAGAQISVPVSEVTDKKIVSFAYNKPNSDPIPMLAYVKPSGKIFVGVNYCIPCKGQGQRIEPDQTLTCETCGTKRNLETQIGVSGACKLYPLDEIPSKIVGGNLVIDKAAMDSWTPQPLDRPVGG